MRKSPMKYSGASTGQALFQGTKQAPSANTEQIGEDINTCEIEHNECAEDSEVSPMVRIIDVEARPQERVRGAVWTVLASTARVSIGQVATSHLDVGS